MTYSPRTFLLGPDDTLYRLARAKFSPMVDDPQSHRLERFVGQRVRMVEVIVEMHARRPQAVVRLVDAMLGFDGEGRLDRDAFVRQTAAIWNRVGERVLCGLVTREATIVEASSRFVARGARGCSRNGCSKNWFRLANALSWPTSDFTADGRGRRAVGATSKHVTQAPCPQRACDPG
jgi:hypothetical protein